MQVITELAKIKSEANQTYNVSIMPSDKIYIMIFGFFFKNDYGFTFYLACHLLTQIDAKKAMRLEQEYAHKVAVASSYASYKSKYLI